MASTGPTAVPFKIDAAVATPSSEWAEATRAALEDKTVPVGSGTSSIVAVPGGTAPVNQSSSILPAGANFSNTTPKDSTTTTTPADFAVVEPLTPGPHVPGAYPVSHEAIHEAPVDTSSIAQDVHSIIQEARERLPAQEDLEKAADDISKTAQTYAQLATGYLPKSIADKFSDYLPTAQASENDAVHDKSLPTQEFHGAQPGEKVGGAGALPGSVDEAAVAKLPGDDASTGLPEGMLPTLGAAATTGVVGYQASTNDAPHEKSFPSQEAHGTQPGERVRGAGALPGGESEAGVARLPATEINHSLPTQDTLGARPGENVGGVGALPGSASETGVAKLPGDDAATGLPEGSKGAAVGAVVATPAAVVGASAAMSNSASSGFEVPARPEDMVSKSHTWPDARSHGNVSKTVAGDAGPTGTIPADANDKHANDKEILIPVAKGANGAVPSVDAALAPAKPEGAGKDTTADDKVRTATSPTAQLEPRKWRAWRGASAPGDTPDEDVDLAENDVGGPPLDEDAHARDLEVQGASLHAEHGKAQASDTQSHSGASAHTQGSKDETKHKASFMEKVKGEVKIISGKLGGNKVKVENGKKLKSGEL